MIIRIKSRMFFKPRFCSECGRLCFIGQNWRSTRCTGCHKRHEKIRKSAKRREARRNGTYKYNKGYIKRKNETIKQHPYCALCGSIDDLTCHHVGGGSELTVLCDECHQAYEAWNNKKRVGVVAMIRRFNER